jgi:predicted 3-demethylubiquinone-9 3-methyltransferase (glyoxalase superfamily)
MTQTPTTQEKHQLSGGPIVPCIWLDDQAEQAARFYTDTFPGGRTTATSYYPASGDNPSGKPSGSVLTVEFELAGQRFTALNGGPQFTINPSISFFVHVDTPAEAERLFKKLESGGQVLMALGEYPWSPRYGWVKDHFGVSWQVIAGRRPPGGSVIAPCLMFTGSRHGQAEAALRAYAGILRDAHVEAIERYAAAEGPEGTVKHGRISVAGQTLLAMDSHLEHGFTFNEGLSLQVMCENQAQLDRYWAALSEGGEEGPCGWLKDRFGVSWQVVPTRIAEWMASKDTQARDRAFHAVMGMRKLDIAAIEAAFERGR